MKLLALLSMLSTGLTIVAAPVYNINYLNSQGTDSVLYTGDPNNWLAQGCGTSTGYGGYNYCQGEILGDLLTGTRASVTSPSMPFGTNGYYFDITNAQSQIVALIGINPSAGCLGSGGSTVTCGVETIFITSLNGGALTSSLLSAYSNIPLIGTAAATGANQTAIVMNWSNGRTDNINFQIGAQATPEPATLGFVGAALLGLGLFRRRIRRAV